MCTGGQNKRTSIEPSILKYHPDMTVQIIANVVLTIFCTLMDGRWIWMMMLSSQYLSDFSSSQHTLVYAIDMVAKP